MKAKSREAFSKNHIHGGAVESNFRHCDAKAKKSCRALQSLKLRPHRGSHFSVSSSVSEPASRKELVGFCSASSRRHRCRKPRPEAPTLGSSTRYCGNRSKHVNPLPNWVGLTLSGMYHLEGTRITYQQDH